MPATFGKSSVYLSHGERSDCIADAMRVRGFNLSIGRAPSPQPPPTGEGAGSRRRCHNGLYQRRSVTGISFAVHSHYAGVHEPCDRYYFPGRARRPNLKAN